MVKLFYDIEDLKLSDELEDETLATKVLISDVRDGEITVARAFEPLTRSAVRQLLDLGVTTVQCVDIKQDDTIIKAIKKDPAHDEEEALKDIYRRLRPGDPPTVANARALLKRLFFDAKKYDLGRVGRYKLNQKLSMETDLAKRTLEDDDFHRRDEVPHRPALLRGHARRHRSSRQPPRADRGRIARQPVPRGPRPHGTPGQGAHDLVRRERGRHDARRSSSTRRR